jgi:polysaccharide biosynthesis protein PslG
LQAKAIAGTKAIARCLPTAAAGILIMLFVPAGASATHLTTTGNPGGPSVPWGFNEEWGWSNGAPAGAFTADAANTQTQLAGGIMPDALSASRFGVQWAYVEGRRGTYDWSRSDALYAAMQRYTPKPIMTVLRAPKWAWDPAATCPSGPPDFCMYPPLAKFDPQWKAFVKAAVKRYPNVRAIEVWNEPNLGTFWAPGANPSRYSAILKAAHDAVRAAGSNKPVVTGGLYPASTNGINMNAKEFLGKVYATAGSGAFEGIGSHPYPHKAPYVETMWNRLDALRDVRNQYGDSPTPLWITEVGISSDAASGVGVDQQGDELVQLYRSVEGHDIASFIIHRLYDTGSEGYWNQYGVLHQDLTQKPAYCELGAAIGTPC